MWNIYDSSTLDIGEMSTTITDTSNNLDFNLITYAELGNIELVESCLKSATPESKEKALCKAIINNYYNNHEYINIFAYGSDDVAFHVFIRPQKVRILVY